MASIQKEDRGGFNAACQRGMGAKFVDANEQNSQTIAFYEKMGFRAFDKSERADSSAPYPIIKMKL